MRQTLNPPVLPVLALSMIDLILPLLGIGLCAIAFLQLALWSAHSISQWSHNRQQFAVSMDVLRQQIETASQTETSVNNEGPIGVWQGFREFVVHRLVRETDVATSVYFKPIDGKPIVDFKPGQHLTFKFDIPGKTKPEVRCYSLSEAANGDTYRITVKKCFPPRDSEGVPPGVVSTFVNTSLMEGDRIQLKAPSGSFFLDEVSTAPVVMLAGGVGITPMASMIDHVIRQNSNRTMILVYGSRNGKDHIYKDHFKTITERHANIHIINVYSDPEPEDKEGIDYHSSGFVSIDLLKKLLPNNHCQFYMCGPGPFMEIMYKGLIDWQVPNSRIFYEAFGPASVKRVNVVTEEEDATEVSSSSKIKFSSVPDPIAWSGKYESILELAEDNGIEIDSGCRAGSCGTCQTALLKGKVRYPEGAQPDCDPGHCLACIAKPEGDVELDV